jgi:putative component of membrane protein insertase Oxa1/YidC/SpoIIIJ protein YidD
VHDPVPPEHLHAGQRLAVRAIERYQAGGGGRERLRVDCNFEPTCSEYTRQAITRFGLLRGVRLGWRRIRRCTDPDCVTPHPDPLPERYDTALASDRRG